jgi:PTH1 family peptidyl-tRNA hydrolase
MNHSGPDVVPAWKAIKSKYSNVHFLVLYDEMGKGVGKYQLRYGNVSSRGHNGLKSLVNSYGNEFYRLGIGIDRPKSRDPNAVADYVLSRTKPEEWATVKRDVVPQVMEIIDKLRKGQ